MDKQRLSILLELVDRPVAFHPAIARIAGGVTQGLMLCQLIYWSGKSTLDTKNDNWVKKSWREFQLETALTQDEQRGARKSLTKSMLIKTERRGLDPVLWYRVDFERLFEALSAMVDTRSGKVITRARQGEMNTPLAIIPNRCTENTAKTTNTTKGLVDGDELRAALIDDARKKGKRDPEDWALGGLRRIEARGGLGPSEELALKRYRACQEAKVTAAKRLVLASQFVPDSETIKKGNVLLRSQLRQKNENALGASND